MEILIGILVFLAIVFLIEGIYWIWGLFTNPERKKIERLKRTVADEGQEEEEIQIVKRKVMSEIPWLNRWLLNLPGIRKIDRLLKQANSRFPLGFFILLSLFLAFTGLYLGSVLLHHRVLGAAGAAILGAAPYLYLNYKKHKRMGRFERQLPEALELIARSLKAGHAFSGGLQMVAEEFPDPAGTEFGKAFDEINYGVGVSQALKNLAERVDVADLKFFVVSVIIQRETGGNLAEILENISYLVRERFKLVGHVKGLTAEGRLSATILCILPFVMAFVLFLINPEYMKTLFDDPLGPVLIGSALFMIFLGIIAMKRITKIRV
jgi:tight adherence protein B